MAGPAVAVRERLYHRWQRAGSLTRSPGWNVAHVESLWASQLAALPACIHLIREAATTEAEYALGLYGLRLFAVRFYRQQQIAASDLDLSDPTMTIPELASATRAAALATCDQEMAGWIHATEATIASLERQLAGQETTEA